MEHDAGMSKFERTWTSSCAARFHLVSPHEQHGSNEAMLVRLFTFTFSQKSCPVAIGTATTRVDAALGHRGAS